MNAPKIQCVKITAVVFTAAFVCTFPLRLRSDDLIKYQTRNMNFGVSGGNANDISRFGGCSGGTLGSLLTDTSNTLYILSNNHVLARFDQASPGENISQPGLDDNYCQPARIVAHYTTAPRLSSGVDAAIAELIPGHMSPIGYIEGIGNISSVVEAPALGLAVEKSGRTTGTTTGTIVAIGSLYICYPAGCYIFENQIVVSSSTGSFALPGDSGSLIVTNASCHQPVGLLFAGTFDGSYILANPIGEVLSKVGAALGCSVSFVSLVPCYPASGGRGLQLPQQAIDHAGKVLGENRDQLMSQPGVLGVGVGALEDNSAAAVIIFVDKTSSANPQLPQLVDGVPVRLIFTDPFVAF